MKRGKAALMKPPRWSRHDPDAQPKRRMMCKCGEFFQDCTFRYALRKCDSCEHKACDNHLYYLKCDAKGVPSLVKCVCCITELRAKDGYERAQSSGDGTAAFSW